MENSKKENPPKFTTKGCSHENPYYTYIYADKRDPQDNPRHNWKCWCGRTHYSM